MGTKSCCTELMTSKHDMKLKSRTLRRFKEAKVLIKPIRPRGIPGIMKILVEQLKMFFGSL